MEALNPYPIPYVARRHHGAVTPQEVLANPDEGANCEATVYAIAMLLGKKTPPPGTRASEFLENESMGAVVQDDIQTGDIIGQQVPERVDFWGTHLAVIWINDLGERYAVHNVSHKGRLIVQPLDEALATHPTHTKLVAVRRLPSNLATFNPTALRELGLGFMLGEVA